MPQPQVFFPASFVSGCIPADNIFSKPIIEELFAEFLKNDWQCPELREYQGAAARLLTSSNFADPVENQMRRALLFIRHGPLWRDLPRGTEWFEAEIRGPDLHRIRVFPRAQWRKLARGNFSITRVAERVTDAAYQHLTTRTFREKIASLREQVMQNAPAGAILIIGLSESAPFTILDGNHRLVAALLASPETVSRLRFFCGLSPRMVQCCWYRTSLATLCGMQPTCWAASCMTPSTGWLICCKEPPDED